MTDPLAFHKFRARRVPRSDDSGTQAVRTARLAGRLPQRHIRAAVIAIERTENDGNEEPHGQKEARDEHMKEIDRHRAPGMLRKGRALILSNDWNSLPRLAIGVCARDLQAVFFGR